MTTYTSPFKGTYQDDILREQVVDNFAGGGGASTGIELALGYPVDIAVNHDEDAIAMHKVNHPFTKHYKEDVFLIDPEKVTDGRPVGIAWFSPDCKHFSKAKGGKPVDKKVRGLSWVILKWAMSSVAPRCIFMENVEEIQTWGPLIEIDGKMLPDPTREGETFKGFIAMLTTGIDRLHPAFDEACEFLKLNTESEEAERLLQGLGYKVEYRVLKACDYGAPTIRKRFYLVARNDGKPIVFPEPTNGTKKGLKPYRTAAECMDWSIPCPSIFGRKKELAINTQRRIARGLDKFVLKNPRPFIMEMNFQNAAQDPEKPMTTQTTANHHYVVTPNIVQVNHSGDNMRGQEVDKTFPTITQKHGFGIVAPSLVQYHSEQSKGEVRGQKADEPIMTIDSSPRYGINACYISKYFGGENQAGASAKDPLPTVTGIDHNAVVSVYLSSRHGDGKDGRGSSADGPLSTVTGTNHSHAVAANLIKYYKGEQHGSDIEDPLHTVTTKDRHGLVESHLCVLRKNMDCKSANKPMQTITTSAGHFAQVVTYIQKIDVTQDLQNWSKVRELLNKYAGYNIADDEILILEINGVQHFIADIGMRMLKAKELKLAQGFPEDYVINIEPYIGKKYSEAKQIARLGNAVCPPVAEALIRANCQDMIMQRKVDTMEDLHRVFSGKLPRAERKRKEAV